MKKIFWTIAGWLTIPGIMYIFKIPGPINPAGSALDRRRAWIALGLSVIAMVIYAAFATYFGMPSFRNTWKEFLSPLFALVWLPNLVAVIMNVLALLVVKGENKA